LLPNGGWKWPNKNKPKVVGGDTLVQLAFECRTGQLKLKELTVEEVVVREQVTAAPNPTVETLKNANDHGLPPSFFLEDKKMGRASQRALRRRIFCGNGVGG
jgi:hypothetical protein